MFCDRIRSRRNKRFAVDEERDAYRDVKGPIRAENSAKPIEKTAEKPPEKKIAKLSERQAAKIASADAVPLGTKITWTPVEKSRLQVVEIETNLLEPIGNKISVRVCSTCLEEKMFRQVYSLDKKYSAVQLILCNKCLALNGKA